MAAASGVSDTSVRRIWRAHGLNPHRVRTFKLSRDPKFVEKVQDVVGLYLDPPQHALVLSVDEKSHVWMAPGSQGKTGSERTSCLQSCVRPVARRSWPLAPMGVR